MIDKINCCVHYSEYDFTFNYPTLVIQGEFGSRGFEIDPESGELERACICSAWSANECCCGAWDEGIDLGDEL